MSSKNDDASLTDDQLAEKYAGMKDPGLAAAAALDAEAAAADSQVPGAPPAAPAPPMDWNQESAHLVKFLCATIVPLWPRLGAVYTPQVQDSIAAAAAPLMEKYDFSLADLFGRYGAEIGFAMVALPLVVPTVDAIKADRAEARAAKASTSSSTPSSARSSTPPVADAPAPPVNDLAARA